MAVIPETSTAAASAAAARADIPDYTIAEEVALVRKITARLIPFLFFLYVIAYIDRVNVGFAKLQMNELSWLANLPDKETVYAVASGIFFIGYFLFEVPSNLLLAKVGARRWIMRIMLTWGVLACSMLFVSSVPSFYALRFALGVAEAGFFPGVLLYLTYWYTARERARIIATFMTANAVSFIVGGPLSGWILSLPTINVPVLGTLAPYQQMFLYEGLPAIFMGFVVLWYLPSNPGEAVWLSERERSLVARRLQAEAPPTRDHPPLWKTLQNPTVLQFCLVFFCLVSGMYGFNLWLPQIIKDMGVTNLEVGLLTAIPYSFSACIMVANGWHSDKMQERRWHIAIPACIGAMGLLGYAFSPHPVFSIVALTVAASGMWSTLGPFWSLPPAILRLGGASAVAAGLAMVNSVGNLGGFAGPWIVGFIKDSTKSFSLGVTCLAAMVIFGGLFVLRTRVPETPDAGDLNVRNFPK